VPLSWCYSGGKTEISPLYSPDLGSTANFFVSPPEEDVAAIQERVTAVLRSIPKAVFADSFQKLYERCQQCVVKDGDYFEGQ
jgi:hypothetical protein